MLQEHILSRRTLEIGTWATNGSCREERSRVHQSDGWVDDHISSRWPITYSDGVYQGADGPALLRTLDAILFSSINPGHQGQRPSVQEVLEIWRGLVVGYTDRRLTVSTDRILAISGIAERFAFSIPGSIRYAAGLWEEDLPISLLWHVGWVPFTYPKLRPDEYQGAVLVVDRRQWKD